MTKDRGFSLIEVLITVIILAVGLLGIAGLQAMGLRFNQSAMLRTQATQLAYDMADRMRTNAQGFAAGNYDLPASTAVADCESTTGCTPAQMATNDMSDWSTVLSNTLPSGAGVVCIDSDQDDPDTTTPTSPDCDGTGTVYVIKIWWSDDRNNPDTLQRFYVSYQ